MNGRNEYLDSGMQIIAALIGLATLAVFLSPKAKTNDLIKTIASSFGDIIKTVVSPITGS